MRKVLISTAVFMGFGLTSAHAASVSNTDNEARTLIVTENGVKNEVVIAVGETVTLCAGGCFITLPNGDRAALSGGEKVEIVGGAAVIK
ncbi:MAG: hypothetical protein U5K75_03385 [Ahrensia sp.]|nr:hypothetical protein [Ahrensia sp.]